jgi:hypothetical protein
VYILQSEGEKEQDKSGENALTTSTNLELGFPEDDEESNNPEGMQYKYAYYLYVTIKPNLES